MTPRATLCAASVRTGEDQRDVGGTRSDRGFTILEVLVALAILSVTLVALYGAIGDSAHRIAASRSQSMALVLAEAKLTEVGTTSPATVGETSGTTNDFTWQVSVAAYGPPEDRVAWPATLLDVNVKVGWLQEGRARSLQLHTLKIVPKG